MVAAHTPRMATISAVLLLATMPVIWTGVTPNSVQLKIIRGDSGALKFKLGTGRKVDFGAVPREGPKQTETLIKLLDTEDLPADLLAVLQESAPNISSSGVPPPAEHSPEVRAELIEPLACTA